MPWLLSASAMDQILEMYYNPSSQGGGAVGWFPTGDGQKIGPSLLGLPATVTDHQPAAGSTGDVILADFPQYLIGDRLTMTVERSQDGGFINDALFPGGLWGDGRYWVQVVHDGGWPDGIPVVVLDVHS